MKSKILKSFRSFISVPASFSILKGTLAYVLYVSLLCLRPVQNLFPHPEVAISGVLLCIAGFPGWSAGLCFQSLSFIVVALGIGSMNFVILSKLAPWPAIQGLVFFIMLYVGAYVKTSKPRFFVPCMFGIVTSWNGFYFHFLTTEIRLTVDYFESYLLSYGIATVVVLFINVCVIPRSTEGELRLALSQSLSRIRNFFRLLDKSYFFDLTEEQIQIRDDLVQAIRADFNILQSKLSRTPLLVTFSRWSADDYVDAVSIIRSMQQCLITAYSNLRKLDETDAQIFKDNFLCGEKEIDQLRTYIYLSFRKIQQEIAVGAESALLPQTEMESLKELDWKAVTSPNRSISILTMACGCLTKKGTVVKESDKALQVGDSSVPMILKNPDQNKKDLTFRKSSEQDPLFLPKGISSLTNKASTSSGAAMLPEDEINISIRRHWNNFQKMQYDKISEIFSAAKLYQPQEPLYLTNMLHNTRKQLEQFPASQSTRSTSFFSDCGPPKRHHIFPLESTEKNIQSYDVDEPYVSIRSSKCLGSALPETSTNPAIQDKLRRSLLRASSYCFVFGVFYEELIRLHRLATDSGKDGQKRSKKIRFHIPQSLYYIPKLLQRFKLMCQGHIEEANKDRELTSEEALMIIRKRQHQPQPFKSWPLVRACKLEKFFKSPNSICALKTASAVMVVALMFWLDSTRDFALEYKLNSCVLTLVVGITPTLSQSWLSLMLQIGGQAMGLIYGMVILEIFHNTGGYNYNPYCLVVAMGLFAIPMTCLIYLKPQLFVLPLLALNSTAVLVYSNYLDQSSSTKSPPIHMAKGLAAFGIVVAIVLFLQLFIKRNPAKMTLRKAIAQVLKANMDYTIILQAYVRATIPIDPSDRTSAEVIRIVGQELAKREIQIQNDITALIPLMKFCNAEPSFLNPFNATEYIKVAKANQLILDRNREARIAIGNKPLPEIILQEFVHKLVPYRRQALASIKSSLYLCTSSFQAKLPFPQDSVNMEKGRNLINDFFHDALILSTRLAHSPEGLQLVKSPELMRYFVYILSVTIVIEQLEAIQISATQLFGKLEEPINISIVTN
ncbi:hypothetical protein O181_009676 [Austropuccinia psidii MF-1]|uniref:Uncharacterized protein n=1 Tax=Austropuccinia psidii MF-1 TaxID=1389203 RepID=A0A9Q3GJP4_9BASI|nr:hypothetical protein [Austropuccinia psidii MF-1]